MCHIHHDPDAIIKAYTDKVVDGVLKEVMDKHSDNRMPAVIRLKEDGLVFQQLIEEDVHSNSEAGERLTKEMNSLGFVHVKFYDHDQENRTVMEYTLTTLEKFEEIQNV